MKTLQFEFLVGGAQSLLDSLVPMSMFLPQNWMPEFLHQACLRWGTEAVQVYQAEFCILQP